MFTTADTTFGSVTPGAMTRIFHRFARSTLLRSSLCIASTLMALGCDPAVDAGALDETIVENSAALSGGAPEATAQSAERRLPGDVRETSLPGVAPLFQMPLFYHQTWRASTYDGHFPNQNSIDLGMVGGSSLGQVVVASAPGTIADIGPVLSDAGEYYGDYVNIDHGGGWETRYLHIVKSASLVKGAAVVRGQRLGTVGQYLDMGVHLHYTQLKDRAAVRIAFNGTQIDVGLGTKKPDGTYPTQDLLSINTPTGITMGSAGGATVTSSAGAGVRAVAHCENALKGIETTIEGPRVAAKQTSTAKCPAGFLFTDATYALE